MATRKKAGVRPLTQSDKIFIDNHPHASAADLAGPLGRTEAEMVGLLEGYPRGEAKASPDRPTHHVLSDRDVRDEMYADPERWFSVHKDEYARVWRTTSPPN